MKTVVVTGANRGIGKETARGLAHAGCKVIMACRNVAAAEAARAEIARETGNGDLHVLRVDLASKASIDAFAAAFAQRFRTLDVLVNNAGISTSERGPTDDGHEPNIGTNFIGTYLLTRRLLPLFDRTGDRAIVNLSSGIEAIGRFRTTRIDRYRWFRAYAVSKRMLLLFTRWLGEQKEGEGFRINAVHPGIVDTSIMYTGKWFDFLIRALCAPFFVDAKEGARTCVELALGKRTENGKFFVKGEPREIRLTARKRKETADLTRFCGTLD